MESGVEGGTEVVIDSGPLQGVRGTILGSGRNGSLIVMVPLLRGPTAVQIPAWCVRVDDGFTDTPALITH